MAPTRSEAFVDFYAEALRAQQLVSGRTAACKVLLHRVCVCGFDVIMLFRVDLGGVRVWGLDTWGKAEGLEVWGLGLTSQLLRCWVSRVMAHSTLSSMFLI